MKCCLRQKGKDRAGKDKAQLNEREEQQKRKAKQRLVKDASFEIGTSEESKQAGQAGERSMGAAAVEMEQPQGSSMHQHQQQQHPHKRMGAAPDASGVQRGAWLPSAGAPSRRVNFRPALNNHTPSNPTPSSLLRPLCSSNPTTMATGKGHQRAGPSTSSSVTTNHEPLCWTPAPRIGAGLTNLGNTCFLNSVLQCLTYTPPLAGYLDSGQHKTTCRATGFCAMCALQEHVRQALAHSGGSVSPSNLVKNLRCISKSFRMWRQEDAHEYLRCLIEGLHNCCLPPGVKSNSSVSQERSLIHKIFGGRLRSQVKCTVCSTCSNTYDPLLDLSLEIVRADSLTKALNRFTAVEALEGDNKYHCSHCRKKVRALKQFTIDKSPNILTIQFKRFSGTASSGGKIDKKVEFGRTLDMKPYISNPQATDAKYSLYAVLVHAGWSTHSGHYYCFVRTKGDMWHALDDSRVKQVSEKSVLDQKAYILFYIKDSVTQQSNGAEQLLRNSLPAFKKLLSDGAGETADDSSSADDLVHNGRQQASNAHPSADRGVPGTKSNKNLPVVKAPGNSQSSSRNDTVDTVGGASSLTTETDGPVPETTNGKPPKVDESKLEAEKAMETPVSTSSDLSSESQVVSTSATVEVEEAKTVDASEANCSTSGEDDEDEDEDDTDWDEYHKHFSNTPQSYMRLLYAMPSARRYFMARSIPIQRDRKRSGCRKGQCEVDHSPKRLCCGAEESSAKKQKLSNGHVESTPDENVSVLRERLQSNGSSQADVAQNGDSCVNCSGAHGAVNGSGSNGAGNGSGSNGAVNGSGSNGVVNGSFEPESSGLRIAETESLKAAAVSAPKSSSNGLYDFEVPRWGEVEANGNGSIKEVDRLLRTHKSIAPERDSWDEEYDRGKVKKVRNKEKQAGFEVNPFQVIANSCKQRL